MLQAVFGGMLGAAMLFGLISGRGDVVFQGFLQGAKDGVTMALALAGSLAVFGGLMHILSATVFTLTPSFKTNSQAWTLNSLV